MTQANDVDIQELKHLIIRLDRKIDVGFAEVDKKDRGWVYQRIDTKFSEVDKKIDVGFANVDTKFSEVDKKIDVGFANVDTKFSEVRGEIKELMLGHCQHSMPYSSFLEVDKH